MLTLRQAEGNVHDEIAPIGGALELVIEYIARNFLCSSQPSQAAGVSVVSGGRERCQIFNSKCALRGATSHLWQR